MVEAAFFICIVLGLLFLVLSFLEYRHWKYQDEVMQHIEDLNIDTDNDTVCEGDITLDRTSYQEIPPTDVILEWSTKSQYYLSVSLKGDSNSSN